MFSSFWVSSSSCLRLCCKVASFIPLTNMAWKVPTTPSVLICRKSLCVNSKCHVHLFPINVNKEITHEGTYWVTNTGPAVLHENSCCQDFTANSAMPVCKIDLKVNVIWLSDYVRGAKVQWKKSSFASPPRLNPACSEIFLSLAPIWRALWSHFWQNNVSL